jgi:hypothetical protein
MPAADRLHGTAHRNQPPEVVVIVVQWLGHGFAHRLVRREVHYRVGLVRLEDALQRLKVANIRPLEDRRLVRQPLQPAQHLWRAVGETVQADDTIAGLQQRQPGVRSDIAGGAGQQYGAVAH